MSLHVCKLVSVDPRALKAIKKELLISYDEEERAFLGPKRHIYCYKGEDGTSQVLSFLRGLDEVATAKYEVMFRRMCDGNPMRRNAFKAIEGERKLEEFKNISGQTRIICTSDAGGLCILLRAVQGKKENKIKRGELIRARALRDEYFTRRDSILARFSRGKK